MPALANVKCNGNTQERLTLKHKNTSKWARRALKRGINVMDATTKEAMEEQLRLGLALRQKVPAFASAKILLKTHLFTHLEAAAMLNPVCTSNVQFARAAALG